MNNKIIFRSRLLRVVITICCSIVLVVPFYNVFVSDTTELHNSQPQVRRLEYGKSRRLQQDVQTVNKEQQDATQTLESYNSTYKELTIINTLSLSKTTPIDIKTTNKPTSSEKSKTVNHKTVKGTKLKGWPAPKISSYSDVRNTLTSTKLKGLPEPIISKCDLVCTFKRLLNVKVKSKASYSSRVKVDSDSLPSNWTAEQTHMIQQRMEQRKTHIKQVCHKYGLDKPSVSHQPNAWEFLINKKHNLIWCTVFKAASSTWFYNFNTLAGYTEHQQLHGSKMPMELARKIYPRPSIVELESLISSTPSPMTFMISRHPITRLVSVYRDKFEGTAGFYRQLSKDIIQRYPHLQQKSRRGVKIPSFSSFVQYILDETTQGHKLNEHWAPMYDFCTPCLVNFNVYAKLETLEEDGNYIIFSTGIEDLIAPKKINLAKKNPTSTVAESYLCQLDEIQINGLIQLYKLDFEIFQYDMNDFQNCKRSES